MLPKCFAESTFGFVGCRRLPKHSKPVVVRPRNRKCDHTTDNWRASRETEEENLTFALRIEHQSTLRAFNLIPGHPVDFRSRDLMATPWTQRIEGSQNFLEINLSAWHRQQL